MPYHDTLLPKPMTELYFQVNVCIQTTHCRHSIHNTCLRPGPYLSSIGDASQAAYRTTKAMDSLDSTALLECPLCDFTVLPSDDYVLQLHFEQVHTTDSPFRINDDAEPLPPPLPPRPSKTETSGSTDLDEREDTVLCTEGDCGELVPLTEFNDHLDYHAAETLSFDETTGKYHSKESANMLRAAKPTHHIGRPKPSSLEQNFNTELPEALRRPDDAMHRLKKPQRGRSDTTSSEKSTLSRSIQTFNPFAWADRKIKPPSNSCRLGVRSHPSLTYYTC